MSEFKIGSRVKAVGSLCLSAYNTGKSGEVYLDNGIGVCVKFDDGAADYGRYEAFELLPLAANTESLKASLQDLHKQFLTAGDSIPAFYLKEVISEHFGVTWQAPQEGRWVENAQ